MKLSGYEPSGNARPSNESVNSSPGLKPNRPIAARSPWSALAEAVEGDGRGPRRPRAKRRRVDDRDALGAGGVKRAAVGREDRAAADVALGLRGGKDEPRDGPESAIRCTSHVDLVRPVQQARARVQLVDEPERRVDRVERRSVPRE